jgi:hypothetical protein
VVAAVELAEVLMVVAMQDTMVSMAMEDIIEAAVEAKVVPGPMWHDEKGLVAELVFRNDMRFYMITRNQQSPLQAILCNMIPPNTLKLICSP